MRNLIIIVIFLLTFLWLTGGFINKALAEDVNIIGINYKYDFFVVDKGSAQGITSGKIFYILKNALQIGKAQVRKAKLDVAACDIIGLVEGARLRLGDRISLVTRPKFGLEEIKYRWREIPPPEEVKEGKEGIELEEKAKKIESRIIEEKQFAALKAKARQIAKEVAEEKKKLLVSFNFKNADIQNVLRIISREKKLNIIASGNVRGKVTASFRDVSVYRALDAILERLGYTYVKEDGIIKVIPLAKEEIDTRYYIFKPTYAKVKDLKQSIKDMLSSKGKVLLDNLVNQMMIIDSPSNLERIKKFLTQLDVPPKQVMIETKVVDVRLTDEESLGIQWQIVSSKGTGEDIPDPRSDIGFSTDGLGIFKFGTIGTTELNASLSALLSEKRVNILSEPSITTLNNKEASIEISGKTAYREWTEETTDGTISKTYTWAEKDTGITLKVTPHISSDNMIRMVVSPSTKEVQEWLPEPETGYEKGYPIIATREAKAEVLVPEGRTLVIGGLIKKSKTESFTGVPILSKVPILGIPFRRKSESVENSELMIFITPHIVEPGIEKTHR